MQVTVAIDCMGGDHGARVTVPAALNVMRRDAALSVILVGQRETLDQELARIGKPSDERLRIVPASEIVAMDEAPASALRNKQRLLDKLKGGDDPAAQQAAAEQAALAKAGAEAQVRKTQSVAARNEADAQKTVIDAATAVSNATQPAAGV